jgi:hypothetical protein
MLAGAPWPTVYGVLQLLSDSPCIQVVAYATNNSTGQVSMANANE